MKKRIHKRLGGFIRSKALTRTPEHVYSVIAVNQKTGAIMPIEEVTSVEEAKQVAKSRARDGFKFYILENNTVLIELV